MLLKLVITIAAVGTLVTGGYFAVKEGGIRSLSRTLTERLQAGDYLAALAAAGKLKEKSGVNPELEKTIAETARLLVAEDTFAKAKQAGEEGRFADARTLLRESEAVTNPTFKYHREAQELLEESEALATGKAHETAVTIQTLEAQANAEKQKRAVAEQRGKTLENTLEKTRQEKESVISKTKAEAIMAGEALRKSQEETEARQVALFAEQARAKQLMEQIEKETRQKFATELRVYRDMAQKGREQIDQALTEINGKRDVTALVYLSQGRVLFEEAKRKVADLRNSRTPATYHGKVDDFIKSVDQFLEAGKQFRNAVVYIENQDSAEFTGSLSKAKDALANASAFLSGTSDFISSFAL